MTEAVDIALGARAYQVVVGEHLLARAGEWIRPLLKRPWIAIVTDQTVARLHLPAFRAALKVAGIDSEAVILPPGESTKSFAGLEQLCEALLALKVERRDCVVALGGGVIGDLTGFAAAILRRGVDFIQVPTTLLAQVDSSVGGKTAIDSDHGKNLIGAFHQPRLVLCDIGALDTLPRREVLAGYAEIAKYGLLGDARFFAWLEQHGKGVVEGDRSAREHAILASIRHKARIVAADEREEGERALLNLGHTFGHALETETGFGHALLHGEAVAIGMVLAFELSASRGHCPAEHVARVERHFASLGLPTSPGSVPGQNFAAAALLKHMLQDKKVQDGRLTFILARGIGEAFISQDVSEAEALSLLERELAT